MNNKKAWLIRAVLAIIFISGVVGIRQLIRSQNQLPPPQNMTLTPSAVYPAKDDLIKVDNILLNQKISSPVTVTGQARGSWYFEAVFPVRILDANGKEIGSGQAQAKSEWTTSDYVPFVATVEFNAGAATSGIIVLKKDNPSGLPQNDNELNIPVRF